MFDDTEVDDVELIFIFDVQFDVVSVRVDDVDDVDIMFNCVSLSLICILLLMALMLHC